MVRLNPYTQAMTNRDKSSAGQGQRAQFHATRWSMVLAARQRQTPEGEAALVWLCERYWRPLYAWARAKGLPPADAEDLVQGFFVHALEGGGLVEMADASRGRFRSYLLTCLGYFWTSEMRRGGATKRGGGTTALALDAPSAEQQWLAELPSGRTPEQEYDRAWAHAVLERVSARLEKECDADGHAGRFAELRTFVDGERGETPLVAAAEKLNLTLPALKSVVHRLRQRMREMVREEIRETVATDGEVDTELQELFRALKQ